MNINHLNDWEHGRVYDVTTDPKRAKQVLKRAPRTRKIASECISIMPDGSRRIMQQATYARTSQPRRTTTDAIDAQNRIDARLHRTTAASLAPIGNID